MWGTHCCKNNLETDRGMLIEECDGSMISLNSTCCQKNEYEKCHDSRGCTDFGMYFLIYQFILEFLTFIFLTLVSIIE